MDAHLDGHGLSGATHLYAGLVHGTQVHQNRPVILIQQNVSGLQVSGERGRRDGGHEVRKTGKKRQGMLIGRGDKDEEEYKTHEEQAPSKAGKRMALKAEGVKEEREAYMYA